MNNNTITTTSSGSSSSDCGAPLATAHQIPSPTTVAPLSAIDTATKTTSSATKSASTPTLAANTVSTIPIKPPINDQLSTPRPSKTVLTNSSVGKNCLEDNNNKTSGLQSNRHKLSPASNTASGSLSSSSSSSRLSTSSSSSSSASSSSSSSSSSSASSSSSGSSAPSSTSTSPDVEQEKAGNRKIGNTNNGKANIEDLSASLKASAVTTTVEPVPLATATISTSDGLKLKIQTTTSSSSLCGNSNSKSDTPLSQKSDVNNKFFTRRSSNSLIEKQNTSSNNDKGQGKTQKDPATSSGSSGKASTASDSTSDNSQVDSATSNGSSGVLGNMSSHASSRNSNTDGETYAMQNKEPTSTFQPLNQAQQNPILHTQKSTYPNLPSVPNQSTVAPPTTTTTATASPTKTSMTHSSSPQSIQLQSTSKSQNQPLTTTALSNQPVSQPTPTPSSLSSVTPPKTTPDRTLAFGTTQITTSPATKPKTTRARKAPASKTASSDANNTTTTTTPSKPSPPKRASKASKTKQATQAASATAESASNVVPPTTVALSTASATGDSGKITTTTARKRKPRSASNDSNNQTNAQSNPPEAPDATASPPKRSRKKKTDQVKTNDANNNNSSTANAPPLSTHQHVHPYGHNPQLLSVAGAGGMPMQPNTTMTSTSLSAQLPVSHLPQSTTANRITTGLSPLDVQHQNSQDPANRYFSLTISPYSNYDYTNAASLTRPSLSRLFTSSSSSSAGPDLAPPPAPTATTAAPGSYSNQQQQHGLSHSSHTQHSDELVKAFDELRNNTWSHLSNCILEHAQQFDIPSLLGTLYTLRSENEKLVNKVRDLTMKRDQLLGINARLDLPGPMLTQHLSHTSPNFSSVVAGLTNSPKSLPNSSPSPAMNKSPLVSGSAYANHIAQHGPPPPNSSLGPPNFIDRSSPLVGASAPYPAGGVSNLKSSTISTPSPPTGALLAHGANNRTSLMTVNNSPYLHPSISALNQLGPNPPSSSYYPRQ